VSKYVEVTLLKTVDRGTNEDFESTETLESAAVFAESKGVTRSEFYAAENTKYRPEIVLKVWADEYAGETRAVVDGVEYTVIRSYPVGDKIELTCQQKGADENVCAELG
jgi:SPP1 family predicted phage head-tail adaptor